MLWISKFNYMQQRYNSIYTNSAFYKAREDYSFFASEIGLKVFDMYSYYDREESIESINARLDGMLAGFQKYDSLVLQFPFFIRPLNIKMLIDKVHHNYQGKVFAFIHDYEPIRNQVDYDELKKSDTDPLYDQFSMLTPSTLLPLFDGIIVNNLRVSEAIVKKENYQGKIIEQGPFGYKCYISNEHISAPFKKIINFAGSTDKAKYLTLLPNYWNINIYGSNIKNFKFKENQCYKGAFPEVEIPQILHEQGGFGLVWDSETFPGITGKLGEYTKISYAHKISLYLAANMPVIIWEKAAGAQWIVDNHLGFAVKDLNEAWMKINELTEEEYQKIYAPSLIKMGKKIRSGLFEKQSLLKAWLEL